MTFKHQSDSYRTRGGVVYKCYGDYAEGSRSAQREAARRIVAAIKDAGGKAFYESHPDGYVRVFYRAQASEPQT